MGCGRAKRENLAWRRAKREILGGGRAKRAGRRWCVLVRAKRACMKIWPIARCPEPLRQMSYLDVSTWEADVAVNIRNFFAARFARGYAR